MRCRGEARARSLLSGVENRSTSILLACIFVLGLGLPLAPLFGEPVVPDIASADEIASAVTFGGVQVTSGIVGPALGELLLPLR